MNIIVVNESFYKSLSACEFTAIDYLMNACIQTVNIHTIVFTVSLSSLNFIIFLIGDSNTEDHIGYFCGVI